MLMDVFNGGSMEDYKHGWMSRKMVFIVLLGMNDGTNYEL